MILYRDRPASRRPVSVPPPFYIRAFFSGRYSFIIADFLFNDKRRRAGIISPFFFMVFHSYRLCPPANGCKVALQAFHIPLLYLDTAFILTAVSFFAMQMHNKMAMCRLWRHALELKRVAVPLHMRKTSSVAYFAYDCGASEAHEVLYFQSLLGDAILRASSHSRQSVKNGLLCLTNQPGLCYDEIMKNLTPAIT